MLNLFLTLLTSTRIYQWFLRKVLPYLSFRIWGYPTYPMENYFRIRDTIKKDQNKLYAFVGLNKWAFSHILNKALTNSRWNHAGYLYLASDGEIRMRHMISSGEEDWSLLDYLREIDEFQPLVIPVSDENRHKVLHRIERLWANKSNVEYDFNFELSEQFVRDLDDPTKPIPPVKLYCSEYILAISYGLVDSEKFKPLVKLDRKVFEPDDVYRACEKLDCRV